MVFVLQTGPCSRTELVPQLAQALEFRTEAVSRKKQPKLWAKTDALNESQTEALKKRRQLKSRVLGIVFLLVGVFLAVPGILAQTGLNTPLIGGIMACIIGVTYLLPQTQGPSRRMVSLGQKLLHMRNTGPAGRICFTEDGMSINGSAPMAYSRLEQVVEMPELYLIVISNGAMFLLKEELLEGEPAAFSAFLAQQLQDRYLTSDQ